jgi:DNA repair exonuclease SbcCD ATPase subunit
MPDDNTLKPLVRVVPCSASKRLEWIGVTEAHNAPLGDLCSLDAAQAEISMLQRLLTYQREAHAECIRERDAAQAEIDEVRLRGVELIGERDAHIAELEDACSHLREQLEEIAEADPDTLKRMASKQASAAHGASILLREQITKRQGAEERIAALEARVVDLEPDARRYRRLVKLPYAWWDGIGSNFWDKAEIDAEIDSDRAIAASGEEKA